MLLRIAANHGCESGINSGCEQSICYLTVGLYNIKYGKCARMMIFSLKPLVYIITRPRLSVRGKAICRVYSCPSVRPSVRPFVRTITFEPTGLWHLYIARVWLLTATCKGLKVKAIGQCKGNQIPQIPIFGALISAKRSCYRSHCIDRNITIKTTKCSTWVVTLVVQIPSNKFKMVHGCHLENRKIAISPQRFCRLQ